MDAWRIAITVLLVVGVIAIASWALRADTSNAAAEYLAPVSGLAGIGMGWLFTNQQHTSAREDKTGNRPS
jgi:hypothetical protein